MGILSRLFESEEAKAARLAKKAEAAKVAEVARLRQERQRDLVAAICRDDTASLERLLVSNPELVTDQLTSEGRPEMTALHLASGCNSMGSVTLLLRHKGDVRAKDIRGATPLHTAAFFGCLETAKLLLVHGAYVNAADNLGFTPIHSVLLQLKGFKGRAQADPALRSRFVLGGPAVLALLVSYGGDVNAHGMLAPRPLELLKSTTDAGPVERACEEILRKSHAVG